ncbi:MAG: hypothetical protein JO166_17125 [Deltaproteobacteria bacterium]|nr:hypothetical protein [Deltaproteobacteria bacterium]
MVRRVWLDAGDEPMTDHAAPEVLAAYDATRQAHLPLAVCFRMGVAAWCCVHPEQSLDYAARQAVTVILEAKPTGTSSSAQQDAAA